MSDIEKLADEYSFMKDSDCGYAFSFNNLKQFAEAYHKAMCEKSEPVEEIWWHEGQCNVSIYPTSNMPKEGTKLYTTPQSLKRLNENKINELAYESRNDVLGVSSGYTTQEQYFAGLIMDEMERINR